MSSRLSVKISKDDNWIQVGERSYQKQDGNHNIQSHKGKECFMCGLKTWLGKSLTLHKNGLCPNCFSIHINSDNNKTSPLSPGKHLLKKDLVKLGMEGTQKKYGVNQDTIIDWINSDS